MKHKVAVIGQGLIGLTSALKLLEAGFHVTIFSKEPFEETNSMSAGAYWWPHKVEPLERVSQWAKTTYDVYKSECLNSDSGVHFEQHLRFCLDPDDNSYVLQHVDEWERVDGTSYGIACDETILATLPVIDVPEFMRNLKRRVEAENAVFVTQELTSTESLFPQFDLVVNCSGVGAKDLVNDRDVYPIRGQVVCVAKPAGLHRSSRIFQKNDQFTLVLPRTNDVVLGGTAQEGDWDRNVRPADTAGILERCAEVVPEIADLEILDVKVGLRPGRHCVRLELDANSPGQPVVHNYGHGGGGFTIAWGCAKEVTTIIQNHFKGKPS